MTFEWIEIIKTHKGREVVKPDVVLIKAGTIKSSSTITRFLNFYIGKNLAKKANFSGKEVPISIGVNTRQMCIAYDVNSTLIAKQTKTGVYKFVLNRATCDELFKTDIEPIVIINTDTSTAEIVFNIPLELKL